MKATVTYRETGFKGWGQGLTLTFLKCPIRRNKIGQKVRKIRRSAFFSCFFATMETRKLKLVSGFPRIEKIEAGVEMEENIAIKRAYWRSDAYCFFNEKGLRFTMDDLAQESRNGKEDHI